MTAAERIDKATDQILLVISEGGDDIPVIPRMRLFETLLDLEGIKRQAWTQKPPDSR